jgi:DHA2 family methylenomycin A resistance protein-like MFS transporter
MCAQLVAIGAGLGLLVPPLTSTLLGSVEKARSGIAAGVLNATRQTGSVLGVTLFGSLVAKSNMFMAGAREALIISAVVLFGAALTMLIGGHSRKNK